MTKLRIPEWRSWALALVASLVMWSVPARAIDSERNPAHDDEQSAIDRAVEELSAEQRESLISAPAGGSDPLKGFTDEDFRQSITGSEICLPFTPGHKCRQFSDTFLRWCRKNAEERNFSSCQQLSFLCACGGHQINLVCRTLYSANIEGTSVGEEYCVAVEPQGNIDGSPIIKGSGFKRAIGSTHLPPDYGKRLCAAYKWGPDRNLYGPSGVSATTGSSSLTGMLIIGLRPYIMKPGETQPGGTTPRQMCADGTVYERGPNRYDGSRKTACLMCCKELEDEFRQSVAPTQPSPECPKEGAPPKWLPEWDNYFKDCRFWCEGK